MHKKLIILVLPFAIFLLGFVKAWPHRTIFGVSRISSYEFFLNCWKGDVRMCDYDPFE